MPRSSLSPRPTKAGVSRRQTISGLLVAAALPWLGGCDQLTGDAATPAFKGIDITGAQYAQDFALTDFNGTPRTLADYRDKAVMLYFGFVQCPDVCPTALTRAVEVNRLLGPAAAERVQLLFVTVDPERDSPELLRAYMAAFDPSFVALTGSMEEIQAAADAFRVYFKKVPTGSTYTMDHTALTYLFDPQGQVRVALRHEQPAADYAADIQLVLVQTAV